VGTVRVRRWLGRASLLEKGTGGRPGRKPSGCMEEACSKQSRSRTKVLTEKHACKLASVAGAKWPRGEVV
jgi:hypothetical protein